MCLARQVHHGHTAGRLGVLAQRPADAQGGPAQRLRCAAGGEDLHAAVPQVVPVTAGPGRGERLRERNGRRMGRCLGALGHLRVPACVGHRQVAADDLHPSLPRPADRGEFGREVGERVEAEPPVRAGTRERDRRERAGRTEVGQPRLEVHRQFHAHHLGARRVQQCGDGGGERRAVVSYAQQVRHERVGQGVERGPGVLSDRHRRFSRRSQRWRQVAEPSSARRRTGPSQYPNRRAWSEGSSLRTTPRRWPGTRSRGSPAGR